MLKLEATLIATTAAQPWRGGWSPDRGIDFIVRPPTRQADAPVALERIAPAEPVSFLDADDIREPGTGVVRRYASLAAEAEAAAAVRDSADVPLTRAWSSLARKLPGS